MNKPPGASRPTMHMCYICGREYGSSSLAIHQKQCKQKWITQEEKKPKHLRKPLPSPPEITQEIVDKVANIAALDGKEGGFNINKLSKEELLAIKNEAAYEQYNNVALVRCAFCNRTFLEDKLAIHNKSCYEGNVAKRVGDGAAPRNAVEKPAVSLPSKKAARPVSRGSTRKAEATQDAPPSLSGNFSSNRRLSNGDNTRPKTPLVDTARMAGVDADKKQALETRIRKLEKLAKCLLDEVSLLKTEIKNL